MRTQYALMLAVCLTCAFACKPAEKDDGQLEGRQLPPAAAPEAPPASPAPDEPPRDPAPSGTAPAGADSAASLTPPPEGCDDNVEIGRECWTEKFPPEISGRSDIVCRFTLRCCGSIVQRWTRAYPQAAGPSGVVLSDTVQTTFGCRNTPTPLGLGDLDGDGTANPDDPSPLVSGGEDYPWK